MDRLLEIKDLHIAFDGKEDTVNGVDLSVHRGEIVGLAGPSGSGKSLTVWSILGLIPEKGRMSGSLNYYNAQEDPIDISTPSRARALSGQRISLVPQNPFTSLNPAFRCGEQISEMLRSESTALAERKMKVLGLLRDLGFEDPERTYAAYPFELSGGQLQRIVIAMAIISDPDLVIADEPTTALDVLTQLEVIELLVNLIRGRNKSLFLVSHDGSLLQKYCDRIYLMEQGKIMKSGTSQEMQQWLQQEMASTASQGMVPAQDTMLIEVVGLSVRYYSRSGKAVNAIEDVSFQMYTGEAIGLIGATGCGKSTIARVLTGLVQPYRGKVLFEGTSLDFQRSPQLRRHVQMIFQDPYSALYPHLTVGAYIKEAIRLYRITTRNDERKRITEILEQVGLPQEFAMKYPHQLSGGERQRVQIARALLVNPKLLICDEITSGLDAAVQGQILQLLKQLHIRDKMTLLLISHDMHVIRFMSDRVLVMDNGKIIEDGNADEIFSQPHHPVTMALALSGS